MFTKTNPMLSAHVITVSAPSPHPTILTFCSPWMGMNWSMRCVPGGRLRVVLEDIVCRASPRDVQPELPLPTESPQRSCWHSADEVTASTPATNGVKSIPRNIANMAAVRAITTREPRTPVEAVCFDQRSPTRLAPPPL